jgi:hypothetical protein
MWESKSGSFRFPHRPDAVQYLLFTGGKVALQLVLEE